MRLKLKNKRNGEKRARLVELLRVNEGAVWDASLHTELEPEGVCVYQDSLLNIHDILRYHFLSATIVITIILAGCKPLCRFWSSADQGNALSLPFT